MTGRRHHNSEISKLGGPYSHAVLDGEYVFLLRAAGR